jgi:hypothetical protein
MFLLQQAAKAKKEIKPEMPWKSRKEFGIEDSR